MSIRRFPPEELARCKEWFDRVEAVHDDWKEVEKLPGTESEPLKVRHVSGLEGVAKPNVPSPTHFRAAHEKLTFDLAHLLELPVPPVLLWNGGEARAHGHHMAISAWAFPQCADWDGAERQGVLTPELKATGIETFSAMRAFHAWISDGDRKGAHTFVDLASTKTLNLAFIDHANSLSLHWKEGQAEPGELSTFFPPGQSLEAVGSTADAIRALPESEITRLVNRIPEGYLPEGPRRHILSTLLSRRTRLREILAI